MQARRRPARSLVLVAALALVTALSPTTAATAAPPDQAATVLRTGGIPGVSPNPCTGVLTSLLITDLQAVLRSSPDGGTSLVAITARYVTEDGFEGRFNETVASGGAASINLLVSRAVGDGRVAMTRFQFVLVEVGGEPRIVVEAIEGACRGKAT